MQLAYNDASLAGEGNIDSSNIDVDIAAATTYLHEQFSNAGLGNTRCLHITRFVWMHCFKQH